MEHIIIVMQCVMSAVLWSMNRQSIIGIIAKGRMNTLIPPCPMIMPTIIGNIVAERVVNMNFLLLVAISVRYMYICHKHEHAYYYEECLSQKYVQLAAGAF